MNIANTTTVDGRQRRRRRRGDRGNSTVHVRRVLVILALTILSSLLSSLLSSSSSRWLVCDHDLMAMVHAFSFSIPISTIKTTMMTTTQTKKHTTTTRRKLVFPPLYYKYYRDQDETIPPPDDSDDDNNNDKDDSTIINPSTSYMSPIQLIKKVPRGETISISTFTFRVSLDESMMRYDNIMREDVERDDDDDDDKNTSHHSNHSDTASHDHGTTATTTTNIMKTSTTTASSNVPSPTNMKKIDSWKTKMSRTTGNKQPFLVTNYLESLSSGGSSSSSSTRSSSNAINANNVTASGSSTIRMNIDDGLGSTVATTTGKEDPDNSTMNSSNHLHRSLRNQQGQIRASQNQAMQKAMYEAMRRTNPTEAIARRMQKTQEERKKNEREKLQSLYQERQRRLDAKKKNEQQYLEERERQKKRKKLLLEQKQQREEENNMKERTVLSSSNKEREKSSSRASSISSRSTQVWSTTKGDIPILDILVRSPTSVDMNSSSSHRPPPPPLFVGSTLTYLYSDFTPLQQKALEMAISVPIKTDDSISKTNDTGEADNNNNMSRTTSFLLAGKDVPIIAMMDSYTTSIMMKKQERKDSKTKLSHTIQYATIASIEILDERGSSSDDGRTMIPNNKSIVKLTGIGRALLRMKYPRTLSSSSSSSYIFDSTGPSTKDLEDSSELSDTKRDILSSSHDEEFVKRDVIVAEFDLLVDDDSIITPVSSSFSVDQDESTIEDTSSSSSLSAINLYRTANRVYRLHEERKKLVAELRAGEARLRSGRRKLAKNVNWTMEFGDDIIFVSDRETITSSSISTTTTDRDDELSSFVACAKSADVKTTTTTVRGGDGSSSQNYGLGTYGLFATIPDLTLQAMLEFDSYYSLEYQQREEYPMEVASMTIFRTLENYATPQEMASALLASTAMERFDLGYEVMMRHRNELNELAMIMSKNLIDCGEECTDV